MKTANEIIEVFLAMLEDKRDQETEHASLVIAECLLLSFVENMEGEEVNDLIYDVFELITKRLDIEENIHNSSDSIH